MKKILLSFVFLISALSVFAQSESPSSYQKKNKVSFGLKLGANLSHMNFNRGFPKPSKKVETSWNPGVLFGGLIEAPIVGNFYIQPEYNILWAGGKEDTSATKFSFSYLSMPLLLKYKISEKVAVVAGPQFELLIKGKKTEDGNSSNITHDKEERNLGATAGIEFRILKHLFLSIRYFHGLNNVGIGQRSNVVEFKYENIQVSMDIKL